MKNIEKSFQKDLDKYFREVAMAEEPITFPPKDKCPRCKSEIGEKDLVCKNCGLKIFE